MMMILGQVGEVIGAIAGIGIPLIGCVYYVATKLQRIEDKIDGLPCVKDPDSVCERLRKN